MPRKNPEARMRLVEHFREFRSRVLWVVLGLLLGAVAGWFLFDPVFAALARPLEGLGEDGRLAALNFTTVAAAFDMRMRVALFIGMIITSPWWLYQAWAFLAPGLKRKEKKYAIGFLSAALPLFLAGATMGWWLLPHAVEIFLSVTPEAGTNLIDARTYLTFCLRLIGAFGIAFLFPVVMVVLSILGVVRARTLLKGWRWAVVGVFTFAAFANPLPDPWSMIALGTMMVGLYFAAVGIAALIDRRRDKRAAQRKKELGIS